MHGVSKRVLFRTLLKGGISKAAISRELGISRRTATRWASGPPGFHEWTSVELEQWTIRVGGGVVRGSRQ